MKENSSLMNSKTCFLSHYPPIECGIATFTKDLSSAMDKRFNPKLKSKVISMNKDGNEHNFDNKVIMQIRTPDISEYIKTAERINNSEDIKIVSIQHEFGIFGGEYGSYLIAFLESLKKPVVVTFHSVLPNPNDLRKSVVRAISERVSKIIVMANSAVDLLEKDYGVEREKIHVIHHGIPNVSFQRNIQYKRKLNLDDKIVLATFGLLSRGKGIEYMIESLPELIKKYPNIVYMIIGETHPNVKEEEGENYRNNLKILVKNLGLEQYVMFYNKYLETSEILDYLLASDVYICTNLDPNQITSGTLAYALGCGRAVVSTPSIYAKEMLEEKRGILAEFRDPVSYTRAIDSILSNQELKDDIEKNAYKFTRIMTWSNVAFSYLSIFNKVVKLREEKTEKLPEINLNHIKNMTDNFGIIEFSKHSTPDKSSGYTLDDNSRALIASVLYNKLFKTKESLDLANIYLDFIHNAKDKNRGFKNNHKNQNEVLNPYSEDSIGRTISALGFTINKSKNYRISEISKDILDDSIEFTASLTSPRAIAFSITGLSYYYMSVPSKELRLIIRNLSDKLLNLYDKTKSDDWKWFEDYLTYDNAKLPMALFLSYYVTRDKRYFAVAKKSLDFLSDICFIDGKLNPIGQRGWYEKGKERALFDQQPIDVSSMVQCLLIAYNLTKKKDYYNKAISSFNWFLGINHLNQMVYDESTGGCFDGLGEHSLNFNQGAESTITYLISRLFFEELKTEGRNI